MANGLSHPARFDLRTERLNQGLTVKGLALELGLHHDTVRKIEDGEPVHPSSAKKVADHFGISVVELLGLEENGEAA
jgi:ribosome-binding protein aMBF1 (putative translation factor)